MATPLLAIRDLDIRFDTPDGEVHAVKGVSLDVMAGETLAVVGESGSGKSQLVTATMGLIAANGRAAGSVTWRGAEILGAPAAKLDALRGSKMTMIFQEPMTSLDPLFTIGTQLCEPLIHHGGLSRKAARARAIELMKTVQVARADERIDAYPHQLSGGQRQRVMIAMAIANAPDLLIADEPTTALDVTVQAEILALIAKLRADLGMAMMLITHDLGLVRRYADRVVVMRRGEIVEQGAVAGIFANPRHDYTKMLLAAEPEGQKTPIAAPEAPILEARGIRVVYGAGAGTITAVDGVDLAVKSGETIGIVGESGSGKSTLGRALLRLTPATGEIVWRGRDLTAIPPEEMRKLRREMQIVFQDPFGSLSPRMTVGEIVAEGLRVHEPQLGRAERRQRAAEALREAELDPSFSGRFPHELSGGQRQRVAIARAMVLKPRLVVLDEPTSALDRSVQKAVVELLRRLQAEHHLTYLFISHDLAVVRALADRILVMKDGKVVEAGTTADIYERPREAYTQRLIAAAELTAKA